MSEYVGRFPGSNILTLKDIQSAVNVLRSHNVKPANDCGHQYYETGDIMMNDNVTEQGCVPMNLGEVSSRPTMTRKRYYELVEIAKLTIEFLESKGVRAPEMCHIRQLGEQVQYLPKGE